jgi:hypothetical protein
VLIQVIVQNAMEVTLLSIYQMERFALHRLVQVIARFVMIFLLVSTVWLAITWTLIQNSAAIIHVSKTVEYVRMRQLARFACLHTSFKNEEESV